MQKRSLPSGLRVGVAGLVTTVLACAGVAGPATSAHAATSTFCTDGSVPMAKVADVEAFSAGAPVTGSSVVRGITPSAFTGGYLGYIADALGKGKDLLLFQLSSPEIDGTAGLKPAGIWAGMSGSPVYAADGSLIGAVSYVLNYDNLPVAGVTPAEYMKTIGTTLANAPATIRMTGGSLQKADGARLTAAQAKALDTTTTLRQVALANVTVASAQGAKLTNALLARVPAGSSKAATRLRSKTFSAVGASDTGPTADQPLVAGGNIAAVYSTGDGLIGAVGTVTAICGTDVWAFGHPMDFAGKTTLGMANASAAMIVPDATGWVGSYKQVTTIGSPQGTITQDRLVGIKGAVGTVAGYPVKLTVRNAAGSVVDQRASTVVLPEAGPDVAASLVANAVIEDLDNYYQGTLRFSWAISYRTAAGQVGTLSKKQTYASTDLVAMDPALDVGDDVYALISNVFADVEITGVALNLTLVSEDAQVYKPIGVEYRKGSTWVKLAGKSLKPGGTYSTRPLYRLSVNDKVNGPTVTGAARTVTLSKKAIKKGSLSYLGTASEDCDIEGDECELEVPDAGSFEELIAQLAGQLPNDRVTEKLAYSRKGSTTTVRKDFTGPGVVEGSTKVNFKVK